MSLSIEPKHVESNDKITLFLSLPKHAMRSYALRTLIRRSIELFFKSPKPALLCV